MIRNKTRDTVLAKKVTLCTTFLSKARGLMFRAPLKKDEAFLLTFPKPRKVWIHMLFVFFPIDQIFLNAEGEVVHLVESARPFQLRIVPSVPVSSLIELPVGTIQQTKTKLGDSIQIGV